MATSQVQMYRPAVGSPVRLASEEPGHLYDSNPGPKPPQLWSVVLEY